MRRVVAITVFHSFITKNILNTDAFKHIKTCADLEIILLVPVNKLSFFEETYASENIKVAGVDATRINAYSKAKKSLTYAHLLLRSHYLWYKKVERRDKNRTIKAFIKYVLEIVFTRLFSGKKIVKNIFRNWFLISVHIPEISSILDLYKIDTLFATDVFDETDTLFMREARLRKIPIIGMVRSWDNCYSKGVLRVVPEYMLVNNETLKAEAVSLHDMPASAIAVTGVPQYDLFVTTPRISREDFYRVIGADIHKKLILFSPAGAVLSDRDQDICTLLKEAITEHKVNEPVQVLVRNHPHHPAVLDAYSNDNDLIIDKPGKVFGQNLKETELTLRDSLHLANTLYHSEMVIYVATTLGLDSLVFDKPQIIVDFDGFVDKPYTSSVRRYHHENHMKKMLACGGVKIVKNRGELIDAINDYLKDPSLDREGRKRMIAQQLVYTDGKSGERAGKSFENALNLFVPIC